MFEISTGLDKLPDVLTVDEAAIALRVNRNTLYEAARRGDIPSLRLGRRVLIPKQGLLRMLAVSTHRT